jgi:predicted transcriptional regulator
VPSDLAHISLQIPTDLDDWFERIANARLTSKSAVIREVLLNHVREQEANATPTREPHADPRARSRNR